MTVQEIFQFYADEVKPALAKAQVSENALPVELLNEIHAAFDHLKRHFVDGTPETAACDKAHGHLKRALIDAYKIDFLALQDEYARISGYPGLKLLESGQFEPAFHERFDDVRRAAYDARLLANDKDWDKAVDAWMKTSELGESFRNDFIRNRSKDFAWANRTNQTFTVKALIVSFVLGVVSGLTANHLFSLL